MLIMKFTDGLWLLKDGVKPAFGLTVTDVKTTDTGVDLILSTRPIRHRGDTLGGMDTYSPHTLTRSLISEPRCAGPVLFVNLSSPSEGIIGLKVKHFGVSSAPAFRLLSRPTDVLFCHHLPSAASLGRGVASSSSTGSTARERRLRALP